MAASEPRPRGPQLILDDEARRALAGPLASDHVDATLAFGQAVAGLLGHRSDTMKALEAALAADPDLAAAQLLRGFGLRVLGRRDLRPVIAEALTAARAAIAKRGGDREIALAEALEAWFGGRADRAADRLEARLQEAPQDALLMKLVHAIRFIMGDSAGLLAAAQRTEYAFEPDSIADGFARGCHAFALEELGQHDRAEEEGRRALTINGGDVWALHAVAHIYYERCEMERGATWLGGRDAELEGVNNFAGHLAWHEALFHIEAGCPERALELHDRRVAVYPPNDYRDVSNASTLLLLLEDHGVDVGDRWLWLASIARSRLGDHGLAFADIHYVLALAGAGVAEEAAAFIASMQRAAGRRGSDFDADVLLDVGAPLAGAILDARAGHVARADETVRRLGAEIARVGGSRAQRRVIPWVLRAARGRRGGRSAGVETGQQDD